MKARKDLSFFYYILSKLIAAFLGLRLEAKWEINSCMESLNDFIEFDFRMA